MPTISVVVETDQGHEEASIGLPDMLSRLRSQTHPSTDMEVIVVAHPNVREVGRVVASTYPAARIVTSNRSDYYGMKNAGASEATGRIIAFLDSDCLPKPDWTSRVIHSLDGGAEAVAGPAEYPPTVPFRRLAQYCDFGHVFANPQGGATGLLASNFALHRDVWERSGGFDTRVRRSGGCSLLYRRLSASGHRISFDQGQAVTHNPKGPRVAFEQRLRYGYDAIQTARLDETGKSSGLCLDRRRGLLAPFRIYLQRTLHDLRVLSGRPRAYDIRPWELPGFAAGVIAMRTLEVAGAMATIVRQDAIERRFGW
ncbi:MAG: glycosyltransferase family A protein [Solirubrobacteraceae bacterium]